MTKVAFFTLRCPVGASMRPYECASLPRRTMHPRRPVGGVVIFAAQVVVVHPRGGRVCVSTPVGLHLSVNAASLPSVPSVALRSPILPVAGRDGNNRTGSSNDPKGAFRRVPAVDGFQPSAVWYRQRAASMCPRYCLLRVLSRGGPVRVAMLLVSWPFLRGATQRTCVTTLRVRQRLVHRFSVSKGGTGGLEGRNHG